MDSQTQKKISYATLREPHRPRSVSPYLPHLQTSHHGIAFNSSSGSCISSNLSPTYRAAISRTISEKHTISLNAGGLLHSFYPSVSSNQNGVNHSTLGSFDPWLISYVFRETSNPHDINEPTGLSMHPLCSLEGETDIPHFIFRFASDHPRTA